MLQFAEAECRSRDILKIELSTSELQQSALEMYRMNGYEIIGDMTAQARTNKTIGGGIRRTGS